MDTFNKIFQVQCVLLIATFFLVYANCHYVNDIPEISFEEAGSRFARDISDISSANEPPVSSVSTQSSSSYETTTYQDGTKLEILTAESTTTTEKAPTLCSSTIRASLIDSVSKVVTEVLEKLFGMFINDLYKEFDSKFNQMLPSFMEKIESFLNGLRINVDKDVDIKVNCTLETVLEKKLAVFGIISDLQDRCINGSQKMNDIILVVFKKIELWINEFRSADTLDSTILKEALTKISYLGNHTAYEVLQSAAEISKGKLHDSLIAGNAILDVTNRIDDFLTHQQSNFKQFTNDSKLFTEVVSDLMKIAEKCKNNFVKDFNSMFENSLTQVNRDKGVQHKLLKDILLVLINLQKNLLEVRIDQANNTEIIPDPDQFEKSSLSDIEAVLSQIFPEDLQSELLSNISSSIGNQVHHSIRAIKMTFDILKNLSSNIENGSVSGTFNLIEDLLFSETFILQRDVAEVLDMHILNSSRSLNVSTWSSTFDGILKNYFNQLYVCEKSHIAVNDSTNQINQFFEPFTTVKPDVDESLVLTSSSNFNDPTNEPFTTLMPHSKIDEFSTQFFAPFTTVKPSDAESSISTTSSNYDESTEVTLDYSENYINKTEVTTILVNETSLISTSSLNYNDSTNNPVTTGMSNLKIEISTQFFEPFTAVKFSDAETSVTTLSSNNDESTEVTPNYLENDLNEPETTISSNKDESTEVTPNYSENELNKPKTTISSNNDESIEVTPDYSKNDLNKPKTTISSNNDEFTEVTPNYSENELNEPETTISSNNDESTEVTPDYSENDLNKPETTISSNNNESTEVTHVYSENDLNETETTISTNKTLSMLTLDSTPTLKIDDTTSLVQVNGSKIKNNPTATQTKVIQINLETKPCHIYKIHKINKTSLHTSSDFSAENEIVGGPNIKPNITTDLNSNSAISQTSETKKSQNTENQDISTQTKPTITTEKAIAKCSSMIRPSLIDSVLKIVFEVLEKLVDMFINDLDGTFEQIFDPMLSPLVEKIASFLNDLRTNVDKDIDIVVNSTLETVLEKKVLAFGIIIDSQQRFVNGSQKMNDTISIVFREIELWVNEFSSVDILDKTLLEEARDKISNLVNHTIEDFSRGVSEVSKAELNDSKIVRNSSLDVTNLMDGFLNRSQNNFELLTNINGLFNEVVSDLIKITGKYQNIFMKDVDSLLVDSLIQVNDEKGLFNKLLRDISLVLINLRKNLLEARINRAKNTKIIAHPEQFEKSSLSEIETVMSQSFPEDPRTELSNISSFIKNQVRDSIRAVKMTFDILQNLSSSTEIGSVSGTFSLIESSLYNTIFTLQKEVPPVLDMRLLNSSSSLNVSMLGSTFDRILRNHSEQLYVCELDQYAIDNPTNKTNFSTSRGIFTYPFEYLLLFIFLFNYLML